MNDESSKGEDFSQEYCINNYLTSFIPHALTFYLWNQISNVQMDNYQNDANSRENDSADGCLPPNSNVRSENSKITVRLPQQSSKQELAEAVTSTKATDHVNNNHAALSLENGQLHGLPHSNSAATIISSNNSPTSSHRRNLSSGKVSIPTHHQFTAASVGSIDDIDSIDKSKHSAFSSSSFRKIQRAVVPNNLSHPSSAASSVATEEKNSRIRRKSHVMNSAGNVAGDTDNMIPRNRASEDASYNFKLSPNFFENVKVPRMKKDVSKCNLFCAFYAEFDNIVGPKVSYQAPRYFMDHDIAITTEEIERLLTKSFKSSTSMAPTSSPSVQVNDINENNVDSRKNRVIESANVEKENNNGHDRNINKSGNNSSSRKPIVPPNSQSIFDSTCEYIITGNELSGQLISLSTHNMHIITKPINIQDEKYERNSFLFSVGFVIRRKSDPSPFRSLLSRLATTLRSMEVESGFLSSKTTKPRIQRLLHVIVSSLNSPSPKCHLLLDDANFLHLQYFPPPTTHAPPVPLYSVPVLLCPKYMLEGVDWDLSIAWIVPFVDGIKHAKLIAESSKVDEEVVLSCLRVLRHHNVLACVDIFRYSNIYESTIKAQQLLSGEMDDLLQEAVQSVSKQSVTARSVHGYYSSGSASVNLSSSFVSTKSVRVGNPAGVNNGSGTLLPPMTGPSSYPPLRAASFEPTYNPIPEQPISSSYNATLDLNASKTTPSNTPNSKSSSNTGTGLMSPRVAAPPLSVTTLTPGSTSFRARSATPSHMEKDRKLMAAALAILYASCQRGMTIGEVWTNRIKLIEKSAETNDNATDPVKKKKSKQTTKLNGKHRAWSYGSSMGASSTSDIDWVEVFNYFDHRRFVTFGIIHGLLSRVHEYPFVCNVEINNDDEMEEEEIREPESQPPSISFKAQRLARRSSNLRNQKSSPKLSPQLQALRQGNSIPHLSLDDNIPNSASTMKSLSKKIAISMDGTRCDDELSCMFQKSMKELKDLVRKHGKKEVISIYSTKEEQII